MNFKLKMRFENVKQQLFRLAVAKQTASHFQLPLSYFFIQRTAIWISQKNRFPNLYAGYCTPYAILIS